MAQVTVGGRTYEVEVHGDTVVIDGHEFPVTVKAEGALPIVTAGGVLYRVQLPSAAERVSGMTVQVDYRPFVVEYEGRLSGGHSPRPPRQALAAVPSAGGAAVAGGVAAQISGRIIAVRVKPGDAVAKGDVLLLLEAMKMENEIKSPKDGVVKSVLVVEGARVAEGETLVVVE